jgi:hypothetical protein
MIMYDLHHIACRISARYTGEWSKPDVLEKLKSYARPGVFIHFSNIEGRFGFHPGGPQTDLYEDNPRGTYCYPLNKLTLNEFESGIDSTGFYRLFIHVLELSSSANIIDLSTYSKKNLIEDLDKLTKFGYDINNSVKTVVNSPPGPYKRLHELTTNLGLNGFAWNKLFRKLGYDGVVDIGFGALGTERSQAVFFSNTVLEHVDVLTNPIPNIDFVELKKVISEFFDKYNFNGCGLIDGVNELVPNLIRMVHVCTDGDGFIVYLAHEDDTKNEYGDLFYKSRSDKFNRNEVIKAVIDGIKKDLVENRP